MSSSQNLAGNGYISPHITLFPTWFVNRTLLTIYKSMLAREFLTNGPQITPQCMVPRIPKLSLQT